MTGLNKYLLFLFLTLFVSFLAFAQTVNPGMDSLFNPKEVAVIEITMSAHDKTFLLANENRNSEEYLHASLYFKNSLIDSLLPDVGIRLRGNDIT